MPRNYSAGAAPRYETAGVWVKTALLRAGFRDEPPAVVIELRPDSAGIPGAKLKEFTQFESDLAVHGELTTLRDRAASLRPPIPWMLGARAVPPQLARPIEAERGRTVGRLGPGAPQ